MILLILVFGGIGYLVGFHFPYEILPGQFANGNYSFNGSIGIGTSSPDAALQIGRNTTPSNNFIYLQTKDTNTNVGISMFGAYERATLQHNPAFCVVYTL